MCGFAGFTFQNGLSPDARRARHAATLRRMTAALRHRGPDAQTGLLLDGIALGHARLAIVDLSGGAQPMRDPSSGLTVIFNGEIYNHVELRQRYSRAHAFRTRSDTEVILAGFASEGPRALERFIGQFAFVLHDSRDGTTWLARDRVGICPLFYAQTDDGWAFASEAKALFAGGLVQAALDPKGVHQSLRVWAPLAPRTCFEDVHALPPGHFARLGNGHLTVQRYWELPTANTEREPERDEDHALSELADLLTDAVRLTLRADVPVAAYLSGGLDSSILCAVAQRELGGTLRTYSVCFERPEYDERAFQQEAARALGTEHHVVDASDRDIADVLPRVILQGEQSLIRAAPGPLFQLSQRVRSHGTKVVLTGEGADEFFLGYDLFKETKIRAFWAKQPSSRSRPLLLTKLYPYLPRMQQNPELLAQFFGVGLDDVDSPVFSHLLRFTATTRIARFFSDAFRERLGNHDPVVDVAQSVPESVRRSPPLARAQYLEATTLLSGYLLSAQGDRMLLGNSVEGRFPFLDHRVIEFAAGLPQRFKLRGLVEKHLLRRYARSLLPDSLAERTKQPYRAPIVPALLGNGAPGWVNDLLDPTAVDEVGVFAGDRVEKLVARARMNLGHETEADSMTLMGVISTQLLHDRLVRGVAPPSQHVEAVEVHAA
jgi:asparagine synthase (glutamine-hydrolysing)